jgi:predicted Rossmann-fold nucleotide-binding protein
MAVEIAEKITKLGFGIITGGGPGIMEAEIKELSMQRENLSV